MFLVAKLTLDRETFKALASETRLALLRSLDERRKTGSELARDLSLNKATVHEHLQLLETVGLVTKVDEGRKWIYWQLTWQGQKLLHPESGATFSVLLGLSVVSAGGAVAALGSAWDWWNNLQGGGASDEGMPDGMAPTAQNDAGDQPEEVESAMMRDSGPGADLDGDDGFWGGGGSVGLVLLVLTALFLVLAMVLRFRSTRKS